MNKYNDMTYNIYSTKRETSDEAIIDLFGKEEAKKLFELERVMDKKDKYFMLKSIVVSICLSVIITLCMVVN